MTLIHWLIKLFTNIVHYCFWNLQLDIKLVLLLTVLAST